MSDTRIYIVPDGQENSTNQMLPWMAMMNGGMGGFGNGMWNNPFMYLVWMWMMRWMNRGEWGDGDNCQKLQSAEIQGQLAGLREQMNTNQNTQLLMDAIKGNSAALGQLATNLNCDFGVLKDCCCNIQNAITTVGGQVGYTSERVINAVERGNCDVIQAINNCCCNTQKAIIEQGYQNQLANERQTYQITNSVDSVGRAVERGFCDSAILLMQLKLRLALFKILLETQVLQILIKLQLSLMLCRIRLYQIRLMLYVKRIVNRLLLLIMPSRLPHLDK